MLAILLIWLYIFLICGVFGCVAAKLLMAFLKEDGFERLPLSLIALSGLGLISAIAGYLSLFLKIGFAANAIFFLGALLLTGLYHAEIIPFFQSCVRRLLAINKYLLALLLLSSLFVLLKSAAPPSAFDTGLYHAQAIRWIEEYPVIPGLGNLHGRLAFNSAWFPPNALFGFSFLQFGPFHVLNGYLLLILVVMSMHGLSEIIKGQYFFSNILRAGLALPALLVFKDQLSSPTPDVAAALLICVVFIYYLQLQESPDAVPHRLLALGLVFLATWAITIKLSSLPLAIMITVLVCREITRGRPKNLVIAAGAVLFLVLPYFLRNIWLSGYLLYPLPSLDLFNLDWKIPGAAALAEKRAIIEFARDPGHLATSVPVKGSFYWLPYWFPQLLADYGRKLEKIFLPTLILLLDWLAQMVRMRTCKIDLREIGRYKVIYLTAGGGLCFWFFTAPDLRFALGFLMVLAIILCMPFLKSYDYHVSRLFPWSLGLVLLYFLAVFAAQDFPAAPGRLWWPAPYPQVNLAMEEIQGKQVYFPRDGSTQCWYAPLPCAYHPVKFEFRGQGVADGFKPRMAP